MEANYGIRLLAKQFLGTDLDIEVDHSAVGFQTYSADPRFSLDFQHPNNYRLRISRVKFEVRPGREGGRRAEGNVKKKQQSFKKL